jgi:D-sedoheptulose 7-phosphate isomerase
MQDQIRKTIEDSIRTKEAVMRVNVPDIERAVKMIFECIQSGHKVLFFGNGGSASDSQHMAAEFVGRYEKERKGLAAIALTTDTSILTAVANDYGYDRVFERQVEGLGQKGDVAVGITTSGNSKNVLLGIRKAKEQGLKTIAFLGRDGGQLKSEVDVAIVIPAEKTARIQESHILVGHIICEQVDELFFRQ